MLLEYGVVNQCVKAQSGGSRQSQSSKKNKKIGKFYSAYLFDLNSSCLAEHDV